MSEHIRENEPKIHIEMGNGADMELTRHNSKLYTFMGRITLDKIEMEASRLDHVFVQTEETDDDRLIGFPIYREAPLFDRISQLMLEHRFPANLNSQSVNPNERAMYQGYLDHVAKKNSEDMPDFIPDDWE